MSLRLPISPRASKAMIGFGLALLGGLAMPIAAAQEWRSAISAGDYTRARVELERALEERPDDTTLHYQLARVLGYMGLNQEALARYDVLLSRYPDNADYLLGRAQMLGRLGQTEEALRVTERALALAPDYEDLWQLRLQLAERAADDDLTAALRAEVAARYPDASWWRRAPRPMEYTRWISVGWEQDRLSNGAPDWSRQFVRFDWRQSETASYFGEIARSSRFDRNDQSLSVGGDWQALPSWRLGGALTGVPKADFEPKRSLSASAGRSWQRGWGTEFQWRRREYTTASVSSYTAIGDRYFSDYRVAYGLSYSRLHGAESSLGHSLTFGWYPSDQRALAISVGAGEEVETVGLNQVLRTSVRSVTLSGREALATRLTLNWWLGTHRQGDFYRRSYAGISVRLGI
jgi:YaiO family outer membrane protein